ncbi:hypothetical protein [Kaarinaea lacus]
MRTICIYLAVILTITGCEFESDSNISGVPEYGLFVFIEANRHEGNNESQIAAAVFDDGESVDLVAGDVFKANTDTTEVLLTTRGPYTGSYAGTLPINANVQNVQLAIVHEPVKAREDRWYPVDVINTDPGPGELVGNSASVEFPPEVTIIEPLIVTPVNGTDALILLRWEPANEGDAMLIRSAIICDNGLAVQTYGTEMSLGEDDGSETISMNNFIYDSNIENPVINFIAGIARAMLQELLNDLSAGNIDADFFARRTPVNPAESECDIRLFLLRQRQGTFDTAFDSGSVTGSTSAEAATIQYLPINN